MYKIIYLFLLFLISNIHLYSQQVIVPKVTKIVMAVDLIYKDILIGSDSNRSNTYLKGYDRKENILWSKDNYYPTDVEGLHIIDKKGYQYSFEYLESEIKLSTLNIINGQIISSKNLGLDSGKFKVATDPKILKFLVYYFLC